MTHTWCMIALTRSSKNTWNPQKKHRFHSGKEVSIITICKLQQQNLAQRSLHVFSIWHKWSWLWNPSGMNPIRPVCSWSRPWIQPRCSHRKASAACRDTASRCRRSWSGRQSGPPCSLPRPHTANTPPRRCRHTPCTEYCWWRLRLRPPAPRRCYYCCFRWACRPSSSSSRPSSSLAVRPCSASRRRLSMSRTRIAALRRTLPGFEVSSSLSSSSLWCLPVLLWHSMWVHCCPAAWWLRGPPSPRRIVHGNSNCEREWCTLSCETPREERGGLSTFEVPICLLGLKGPGLGLEV